MLNVNLPAGLNWLVAMLSQLLRGSVTLVVVSIAKGVPGVPPAPARRRLLPDALICVKLRPMTSIEPFTNSLFAQLNPAFNGGNEMAAGKNPP